MAKLSEAGIEKLIDRYKKSYLDNPSFLLSGYSQEKQTVADYEGRQLLELIQNADDAKSDVVYIYLDTLKNELKVSNNGDTFSLEGVESLMYTGLSTKNKFEYIGNKGLGFRSILSWVNWVEVRTNEVGFRFSKDYSVRYFEKNLQNNALIKKRIEKEIAENRLSKNEIPIATLAFPEPRSEKETKFTTSVVLQFKEGQLASIEKQLKLIKEETLLFLPNIKNIVVVKDGAITKELHKTVDSEQLVKVNDKTWNVFRVADQAYDENVKFNYTIAWQDSLENNGYFYNYFKTDVPTALPCIIHATFNLTNNRKEINDNNANKHILNCVVDSLAEIVATRLKKDTPNWGAYSFLTPSRTNSRDHFKKFYNKIEERREESKCYPSLDGKYLSKEDAIYQGEAFSKWVLQNNFGKYFPNLLLPVGLQDVSVTKPYSYIEWKTIINDNSNNSLSNLNPHLDLNNRVALLKLILNNETGYFDNIFNSNNHLPLLLDVDNNVVSEKSQVFTNDVKDAGYDFPDYIQDISFISHGLYDVIKKELKKEIGENRIDTESGDSRAIKRLLDNIVNIGSDDITVVIQHIVRKTNEKIKLPPNPNETVLKMVHSLFSIFNSNKERRGNLTTIKNISLLSRAGGIVNSDELYFGKDYSIGIFAEQIFEGIRLDNDYLADTTVWNLDASEEVIVSFFQWLNVNLYSKIEERKENLNRGHQDDFVKYMFDYLKPDMTDVHKDYAVKTISGIDDILKHPDFSLERLIAWIAKDEFFMQRIHLSNEDYFSTSYNRNKIDYKEKPSYLTFQIYKSGITKNVVASIPVATFGKIKTLNREHPLLSELKSHEIYRVLDLLQIRNSFNELEPKLVYSLLNEFGSENNTKNSQQVYKLFYEYFRENEEKLTNYQFDFKDIRYAVRNGGRGTDIQIRPIEEVYYSDNKILPQKILDNYWFINLPNRIGEDRVKKYFGVNLIKDLAQNLSIDVINKNSFEDELNRYLRKLKPYLLAYRIESMKTDTDKKEGARAIDTFAINLVAEANLKMSNGDIITFDNYDSISKDKKYYIKYDKNISKVESLTQNSDFCDVIAEALCIVFKVNDLKNIFRTIFKDGAKESEHVLKVDDKKRLLEEAKKLLGVSEDEKCFWETVFNQSFDEIEESADLKEKVEKILGSSLNPKYYTSVDFSDLTNPKGIEFLKWLKQICTFDIKRVLKSENLNEYHLGKLFNALSNEERKVKYALWLQAKNSTPENQETFFSKFWNFKASTEKGGYAYNKFLEENSYELEPNYKQSIYEFVNDAYQIDLSNFHEEIEEIEPKYDDLLNQFDFGNGSLEDKEKIIMKYHPKIYSLLYFENYQEEVKEVLLELSDEKLETENKDTSNKEYTDFKLVFGTLEEPKYAYKDSKPEGDQNNKGSSDKENGRGQNNYDSKSAAQKGKIGKEAEEAVKAVLQNKGYEVIHESGISDGVHYDIKYKKQDSDDWRLLEVKTDSGGHFFLSKQQLEKAEEKQDIYDIAIVRGKNVQIVETFFNHRDKVDVIPNDYIIRFSFKQKE